MCGASATGIFLVGAPLIALPRELVVRIAGCCSFCGAPADSTRMLAGKAGRSVRVCSQCVDLCLEILDEEAGLGPPRQPDPKPMPADEIEALAELTRRGFDPDELVAAFETPRTFVPKSMACSFCDADKEHAAKLIAGPDRVYICDLCVAGAAALVA